MTRFRSSLFVASAFLFCAVLAAAPALGVTFQHVLNVGSQGPGPGQFQYVEDMAWDASGNLLATDATNANVQVFDRLTGKFISQFGGKGDGDAQFEKPEGIAVDKDGNIFVADYMSGYIKKFDKNHRWLKTFSDYGTAAGENMESEFMDVYNGLLYMAEAGNSRVDVFDLNGEFKFLFGGKGSGAGQMTRPEAAKSDGRGNIYVCDLGNNRVQIYTADGTFIKQWGKEGSGPGEFNKPTGLALDRDGNVYVGEVFNNRVQMFDKDGNFIAMWGKSGSGNGEFSNIHGLIVDSRGYVYVADTGNNRIQVFKPVK